MASLSVDLPAVTILPATQTGIETTTQSTKKPKVISSKSSRFNVPMIGRGRAIKTPVVSVGFSVCYFIYNTVI